MTFDKRFVEGDPESLVWNREPVYEEERIRAENLLNTLIGIPTVSNNE